MILSYKKLFTLTCISIITLSVFIISDKASAQEPTPTLQPTQVIATIPQEYNEVFSLQWGGGSLYQLKQRLATMSCIVDTIWVYNNNQWHPYNQYQVPSTLTPNINFKNTYSQLIPAGTLYASCFDICEFGGRECITFEIRIERASEYTSNTMLSLRESNSTCTDDFDSRVKEQILPLLAIRPDLCIIRQVRDDVPGIGGRAVIHSVKQPFILVYGDILSVTESARSNTIALQKEIHELCHINQYWYWIQQLQRDAPARYRTYDYFESSMHGKEFIDLVGFTQTNEGVWDLPADSVFRDVYSPNPAELSAELCSLYFLDIIDTQNTTYEYIKYDKENEQIVSVPYREVDVNTYLTPEIRQWLETYVVLPQIT